MRCRLCATCAGAIREVESLEKCIKCPDGQRNKALIAGVPLVSCWGHCARDLDGEDRVRGLVSDAAKKLSITMDNLWAWHGAFR